MRRTPKSSWICLPLAKIQYLNEITNERGVVFATETPISNSMAELYTMQRYLKPSRLEKQTSTISMHGQVPSAKKS